MLRKFAGSAVAAKVNFGGHSAAAYPALSRVNIRGHSAAAKVTLAAEAQPAKLRKVGGYHLGANDEHAAVLTPPKLRNIGGRRSGRQNSAQISGFAKTPPPRRVVRYPPLAYHIVSHRNSGQQGAELGIV